MSTPLQLRYVPCSTCGGTGVLRNESAMLQCMECQGSCGWLETSTGQRLIYPLPPTVSPGKESKIPHIAGYALAGIGSVLTLTSLTSLLITSWPTLSRVFWQPDKPMALVFGMSGLITMAAIAVVERWQTSSYSLHELPDAIAELPKGSVHSLAPYMNSRVVSLLNQAAAVTLQSGRQQIDDIHLLTALFEETRIQMMLARLELDPLVVAETLHKGLGKEASRISRASFSSAVCARLYRGYQEAIAHDFPYIDLEDIVLAYLPSQDDQPDEYTKFLNDFGITRQSFSTIATWYAQEQEERRAWEFWLERGRIRPKNYMNRGWTALPTPFLDQFSTDLTLLASYGKVTSGQSRRQEVEEALTTLAGSTIRNVLFVGEPGSGTDTILTALATRMLEESVPDTMKDRRFISVDLARLLTTGENAQAHVQHMLDEVHNAGNIILAIPEIHALADSAQAQLDGSSILANALKQNDLQIVSTATFADYHRYVEQNSLLKSQLHVIELHPLSVEETIRVLEGEAGNLEAKHDLRFSYPALETAAQLAEQYLTEDVAPAGAQKLLEKAAQLALGKQTGWVNKDAVKAAVESLAHVPVTVAQGAEAEKLLNLENLLHQRVIGQSIAVHAVAEALRRARTGLSTSKRPVGSFLFVGPTGVGKTELAKALCAVYFQPENNMIRFDMSEYQEPRSIYKLIGAPADAGQTVEGGELTQAVREHPFSLLLFDEIEKAHPDVLNLFLQILDDGRVTENTGRTVNMTTCIIIATSNAGSSTISQLIKANTALEQLTPQIMQILEQQFKPEFLNRFDGVIPFEPLGMKELQGIAALMIKEIQAKATAQGITLVVTEEALQKLIEAGYNPAYGARPLRRTLEQKIEGIMANKLLKQEIHAGDTLQISPEMLD
jgi:ATP-dependent Clp protease ATP-binding subunit ClpA